MGSHNNIKLMLILLVFSILVSACGKQSESGRKSDESFSTGTHLDASPLQIIGQPVSTLYYDVEFEFEFGASGGDGLYQYRYIQNPELGGDGETSDSNILEFSIENTNAAKPSFWLRGVPRIPEGSNFDSVDNRNMVYGLEVTDGRTTLTRNFSVTVVKNQLSFAGSGDVTVTEGTVRDDGQQFFSQLELDTGNVCEDEVGKEYVETLTPDGQVISPVAIEIRLDRPPSEPVELFYRVSSDYDSNAGERSDANASFARPGVDFIAEEKSVIFGHNQFACLAVIQVIDDQIIEGDEALTVEFYDRAGANVDFIPARINLIIRDNEPVLDFVGEELTRNSGDTVLSSVELSRAAPYQLNTKVGFSEDSEPYDSSLFTMSPVGGGVSIEPGDDRSSFSIHLQGSPDLSEFEQDPKLIFGLDVESIFDLEQLVIWVNEWASTEDTRNEEVVAETHSLDAVSVARDDRSNILLGYVDSSEIKLELLLKGYSRKGESLPISESGDIKFGTAGVDVEIVSVMADPNSSSTIVVVAHVNGRVGDTQYGGTDFAVFTYGINDEGLYELENIGQLGTEADDQIIGTMMDQNGVVYIWGKSEGKALDGALPESINRGGADGILYKYNAEGGAKLWSRFIGTENQDAVVGVDVSSRQLYAFVETSNGIDDANGMIWAIDNSNGDLLDSEDFRVVDLTFDGVQDHRDIKIDGDARNYYLLTNSRTDLQTNLPSDSGTTEVNLSALSVGDSSISSLEILTSNSDDTANGMILMSDDETLIVFGETQGVFNGQLSAGGQDAFISIFDLGGGSPEPSRTVQFGTPGDDFVIDAIEAHPGKFMVLWQENHSSGDGSITYRLSPFSVDGEKLTPDPR